MFWNEFLYKTNIIPSLKKKSCFHKRGGGVGYSLGFCQRIYCSFSFFLFEKLSIFMRSEGSHSLYFLIGGGDFFEGPPSKHLALTYTVSVQQSPPPKDRGVSSKWLDPSVCPVGRLFFSFSYYSRRFFSLQSFVTF